jgi:hypothetical protein
LKTTFEDVFPAEATTVEEYLQQVTFPLLTTAFSNADEWNDFELDF